METEPLQREGNLQSRSGSKEGEKENDEPVDSDSGSELEDQNQVVMETAQTSSKRMDSSEDDDDGKKSHDHFRFAYYCAVTK